MSAPDQITIDHRPLSAAAWQGGRTLSQLRISPDGSKIAYVNRVGVSKELVVRNLNGVDAPLALDPPLGGGGFDWMPDGNGIVYSAADKRLHLFDLASLSTRAITQIDDNASAVQVSPDGSHVLYVVDDLQAIAIASLTNPGTRRVVADEADFAIDPVWSPDGSTVAWIEWDVPNMAWDTSRLMVRDAACAHRARAVVRDENISVQQPRFSPDGRTLAFLSDATGWLNLWSVDAETFTDARPIVEETFEHGLPTWGSGQRSFTWCDDDTIAFNRNEHGWYRLAACNVSTGAVRQLLDDGATDVDAAGNRLVFVTAAPDAPVYLKEFDLASGDSNVLTQASPLGIERHGHQPELVHWHAEDGTELHGRFYSAGERRPLLVYSHGGPTSQSPATLHARFDYFVERGWSVLNVDYRGTTGWGRDYQQAMRGRWGEIDISDVASGTRYAIEQGWCDPAKVVAFGGSAGGFTSLLLLARHPELFAAGVVQYPVADLVDLAWTTWRFEAHYLDTMIGPLPAAHAEYLSRSPIAHAGDIKAPLLVLQGDRDEVVDLGQVQDLVTAVRRNGTFVDMHVYEGEGHGWRRAETRADELERVEEFLRRHVLHVGPNREVD